LDVAHIGRLHIPAEMHQARFAALKLSLNIEEVLFLSTCNRVEYQLVTAQNVDTDFLSRFFANLYPEFDSKDLGFYAASAAVMTGIDAVEHVLKVASSIDSLVVGEREIITQVRQSYEQSRELGLSGDFIRVLIRHTIETAKRVYTETKISQKPVSVVSIAYQRLQSMDVASDARVLVVGAGVTNTAMTRFLKKHGMNQFAIFNRSLDKAQTLAEELGGLAYPLSELSNYSEGFDILVACTGADHALVDAALYEKLLQGDTQPKITIDLALPNDIADEVHDRFQTRQISINVLQRISDNNLQERSQEIAHVEAIVAEALEEFKRIAKMREIEVAMRPVPQMVKEIKAAAFNEIFKNEIDQLDENSLEVLEKITAYMEKKYMSMPMLMAKEILIKS
jgi:glutamyl-tRNA reductase